MLNNITIDSTRLKLRDFVRGDEKYLFNILKDPEVSKYIFYGTKEYTLKDAKNELEVYLEEQKKKKREDYNFAAELNGIVIGVIVLGQINYDTKRCYLHYHFNKLYWGKGYAKEAVNAVIDWAFDKLGLKIIEAESNVENNRSKNMLLKLGFKKMFFVPKKPMKNNVLADVEIYSLER